MFSVLYVWLIKVYTLIYKIQKCGFCHSKWGRISIFFVLQTLQSVLYHCEFFTKKKRNYRFTCEKCFLNNCWLTRPIPAPISATLSLPTPYSLKSLRSSDSESRMSSGFNSLNPPSMPKMWSITWFHWFFGLSDFLVNWAYVIKQSRIQSSEKILKTITTILTIL